MLVLSRKKNESIVVDDTIVITVVEIRGDKVRLGIEAPREVPIHRSEVRDAMAAHSGESPNNDSANNSSTSTASAEVNQQPSEENATAENAAAE